MDITPSAFTPFLRRFTDEKARDLDDTVQLYTRVARLHAASRYRDLKAFGQEIFDEFAGSLSDPLYDPFGRALDGLLKLETPIFALPKPTFNHLSLQESVDLRHFLRSKEYFHTHEEEVATRLKHGLALIFSTLAEKLPQTFAPSPFMIPLIYTLPDPKGWMEATCAELWQQKYIDAGLFVEAARQIYFNLCRISGIADPHDGKNKKPLKFPLEQEGSLEDIADATFRNTPFHDFFLARIPLKFTDEDRFSHMHVLGGSGAGKTTLLQNLILSDLKADDPPSLVIVDSQGDLINKLSRLEVFSPDGGALHDRLLIISPKDIKSPPAINIFDVNRERLDQYDEATKEQVVAGVIQTFDYVFSGLIGADLTAKQGVFFRFVARLMLSLPETLGRTATILDMIALMDDPAPYRAAIEALPPIQRNFFERDFASKTFAQTKEQIRYRLNAILENPTLARLFTSPRTKIDLFERLNAGSIILVDTAKDFLKGASAHFGRIIISQVLQAILERAVIPEWDRKPTFLVVDEAASYFDSNIDDFLTEARKYKCGCVFAHQFLDQATSSLRASLAANTTIKFAAGISNADARAVASDMRTTADFILSQPRLTFAAHIRNVTPNAVSIPVPVGQLEREPRMAETAYRRLAELHASGMPADEIAARYGVTPTFVLQRLKLAAVSPRLVAEYRQSNMTLEQLSAFTLTDDHRLQEQVWFDSPYADQSAEMIRRQLTKAQVDGDDRRARFIGAETYKAAGGIIVHDLFDEAGEGYFADSQLLDRLVAEKLEETSETIRTEGWQWVEVHQEWDYTKFARYGRAQPAEKTLSEADEERLSALGARYDELVAELEAEGGDSTELDAVSAEIDRLDAQKQVWPEEEKARAGAVVCLDSDGSLKIVRGLIRPEAIRATSADDDGRTVSPPKPAHHNGYSGSIVLELSAQRTAALREVLASQPQTALLVLLHTLAGQLLYPDRHKTCLGITATEVPLSQVSQAVETSPAAQAFGERRTAWFERLPEKDGLWDWLATLNAADRLNLLAFCIAMTVNALDGPAVRCVCQDDIARLVVITGLDMGTWWKPTRENFLDRLTKQEILAAVSDGVSPNAARHLSGDKKDRMAAKAEMLLAETGWLPLPLRSPVLTADSLPLE